jgi:hypothetical protein
MRHGFKHWWNITGALMLTVPVAIALLYLIFIMIVNTPGLVMIMLWVLIAFVLWFYKNNSI